MHAILKEEPPETFVAESKISPGVERLMRRCLEKAPGERFQSARDLGFALEALSGSLGTDVLATSAQLEKKRPFGEFNWRLWCLATAGLLMAFAATLWLRHPALVLEFVQLTNDNHAKNFGWPPPVTDSPLITDGARLYLTTVANLGAGPTPAQVSVKGGEIAPIHLSLPYAGFELLGISPDGSELLVGSFNDSFWPQGVMSLRAAAQLRRTFTPFLPAIEFA
jgi:eukaryotic-like serine/threonine-protein kinase